ncbi:orotidine-5'-phosphate decarboxylase [Ornithinimicrobium pratense]|uniref:Orotidine-5'-phosphate decarboxylase n=1 Tax=Ornithinimicrobium pratense TaxID=2593973 RepID=A0A5J6V6W5_9MICO|nr:orotidine-5'-phosphate decarboxylase [Ornithinimicrobium pratense]QFG68782.1 orotidine-5'-phosphate decarboxylase [Ornithinimicrobium pratense]
MTTPDPRPGRQPFGERLLDQIEQWGPLCVGLDPHPHLLADWGLPDTPEGLRSFSLSVLDAAENRCAAVKPQSAFYERHGSAGVAVLEEVLAASRERGLLSVLDAKRGDIGSTMGGYAQAYLQDGSPLVADSVTLSPYLGYGSLRPALDLAAETARGVWVLGLTSNPEGAEVQLAGEPTVAARILEQVAQDNAGAPRCGHVGLVVGATLPRTPTELGLDLAASGAPVLTPGVGAQGADEHDVARTFAGLTERVLVPIGRGVLESGPDGAALATAIQGWSDRLRGALRG